MPYSTRKGAFKQIDSTIGNLETALYHLNNVKVVYEPEHPEIAKVVESIMVITLKAQELTKQLRKGF